MRRRMLRVVLAQGVCIGMAALYGIGCAKEKAASSTGGSTSTKMPGGSAAAAPAPATVSLARFRARMLARAESAYTYESQRAAEKVSSQLIPKPGGTLPTITVSTAKPKTRADSTTNRFVARLTSSGPYPTLGIATGVNYVWRDSVKGTSEPQWRILVVPKDTTAPMTWILRDSVPLFPNPLLPTRPRLAKSDSGFGMCYDCRKTNHFRFMHCTGTQKDRDFVAADTASIVLPVTATSSGR